MEILKMEKKEERNLKANAKWTEKNHSIRVWIQQMNEKRHVNL